MVLERIGRADVSASEAYALANSLKIVIDADPAFAVEVYAAIFAHEEKSRKTTQMGDSKVLVLTSTRAQNYSMAYYILGVRFNHFLERNLDFAALAAIRSVCSASEARAREDCTQDWTLFNPLCRRWRDIPISSRQK
jgi:hypothetical protein